MNFIVFMNILNRYTNIKIILMKLERIRLN